MADDNSKRESPKEQSNAPATVPPESTNTSSPDEVSCGISSSGTQATNQVTNDDLISALHKLSLYKSPREFFEDLIIARAPERAKGDKPPTSSSSPEEIAQYREMVLNHPDTKHRFVFQEWPRDPKGEVITPDNSGLGRMSFNGEELWGASLFDLYTVRRIPSVAPLVTYTSGSKLENWMESTKETYAQDLIRREKKAERPDEIEPYDIGILINEAEMLGTKDGALPEKSWNKDDPSKRFELPESWPPASPFSSSAYPAPWPILPFTAKEISRIPTLQKYILPTHLPAKLVVHDPFYLLAAETPRGYSERQEFAKRFKANKNIKWDKKEDVTHTYRLQQSELNKIRRERDTMQYEAGEEDMLKIRKTFLADPHTRNELPEGFEIHQDIESGAGPVRPPIYVVLPSLPNKKQIEEAHLYIAPVCQIGEGNHSFVYKAELEVPRDALVEPEICNECVIDDTNAILLEQDGENSERRNPKWDKKSGEYVIKTTDICPQITEMKDPITGKKEKYIINPGEYKKELVYQGPFRVIESRVKYQDLAKGPYCKHRRDTDSAIHPLTSKVYVAAKLSKKGDRHLAAEAESYQKFPRHFFDHASGYNILEPIHDPVPLGALVPQFYGYYVVDPEEQAAKALEKKEIVAEKEKETSGKGKGKDSDEDEDEDEDEEKKSNEGSGSGSESESESDTLRIPTKEEKATLPSYLSPILLLEDCGEPLVPKGISKDDKIEAGSIIYRFHNEGWLHGSVAKRNIVRQPGPINASPSERAKNAKARGGLGKDWSYRLIDFGRSTLAKPDEQLFTVEASMITGWIGGWSDHEP